MAPKPKSTHAEAHYRVSSSATNCCENCIMYVDTKPPDCKSVQRPIHPSDVCDYFEKE